MYTYFFVYISTFQICTDFSSVAWKAVRWGFLFSFPECLHKSSYFQVFSGCLFSLVNIILIACKRSTCFWQIVVTPLFWFSVVNISASARQKTRKNEKDSPQKQQKWMTFKKKRNEGCKRKGEDACSITFVTFVAIGDQCVFVSAFRFWVRKVGGGIQIQQRNYAQLAATLSHASWKPLSGQVWMH